MLSGGWFGQGEQETRGGAKSRGLIDGWRFEVVLARSAMVARQFWAESSLWCEAS
jgi:hypothetical protein